VESEGRFNSKKNNKLNKIFKLNKIIFLKKEINK
jgi:hypothetical protein